MPRIVWGRFCRHPGAVLGLAVLVVILVGVGLAFLSPYDPQHHNIQEKLQKPSLGHPMGTDALGRDVFTRVLYGGRLSLLIGFGVMLVSLVIGVPIGMAAGYYGGSIDTVLMRITDMVLSFPSLFVLILFSAMLRETNIPLLSAGEPAVIILAIGVLSWMTVARLVRASFLSLREMEFITAARCIGASNLRIAAVHMLPNTAGPVIVAATLLVAHAILTESGLSFIGFGVHPRIPTWGNLLTNAQRYMTAQPWIPVFPGLIIFVTVVAINYVGDGLRDALDPHSALRSRGT